MRTGRVVGVSIQMSGEEYVGFEQKVTKETKEEDRSCWGVETAWLVATVGLAQARGGGSTRASPSLRILRFLRCLLFKNPIQLPLTCSTSTSLNLTRTSAAAPRPPPHEDAGTMGSSCMMCSSETVTSRS